MRKGRAVTVIVLAAIVCVLVKNAVFYVDKNQVALVFQSGSQVRTETQQGWKFKLPVIEWVGLVDLNVHTFLMPGPQEVRTKDGTFACAVARLTWQVKDPKALLFGFVRSQLEKMGMPKAVNDFLDVPLRSNLLITAKQYTYADLKSERQKDAMKDLVDNMNNENYESSLTNRGLKIVTAEIVSLEAVTEVPPVTVYWKPCAVKGVQ